MFTSARLKLLVLVGSLWVSVGASAQSSPHVAGELLVSPKAHVSDDELEKLYKAHGGKKIKAIPQIRVHRIRVPEHALDAVKAALQKNPHVQFVEKNLIGEGLRIPNDPSYSSQWHLPKISAPQGWDMTTGAASVPIAVIDSGVDPAHPDLAFIKGRNFLDGYDPADTRDVLGHGTAVAGAAAALGNSGIGVSGVTWSNPVMPLVVVTSSNTGTTADAAEATVYAADNGARVVNMSIGWTGFSSTLQNAVNYAWNKGLVIVAAAGNYGTNSPLYPAAMNNVVAVSATDTADNLASWSNYGDWVDVSAPGVSIYTTANGGGYRYGSGTSFASPVVAGVAALIFSLNPSLSNAQVVDVLKNNCDDLGAAGFDAYYGSGRVNAARALQAAYSISNLQVEITSPANGATVAGIVNVEVSASSSLSITKVELYVDGLLRGAKSSMPYSFAWDTTGLSGSHTLVSRAYDASGTIATSPPETVTVAAADTTPPTVHINGLAYDGRFATMTVSATDASGIAKVEIYVNGKLSGTDTSNPYSFKLNTKPWKKGTYYFQAKAYDVIGNSSTSTSLSLTK